MIVGMAVSASFYQNVFLLNQLVPANDDFKKLFREGMFDKPNIAGFVHVSHYLLMIYDTERFKTLIEWPITCKKSEAKYRNDVKDYLNVLALENPDIGFPPILATYLHHASGTKFIIIMWKLSQLALKKYIMCKGGYEVISVPKLGPANDLAKTYLQQYIATITHNVSNHHRKFLLIEEAANSALVEGKEEMTKIKAELFDKKQSMVKCATAAPVAASIKEHLANVENSEIIQMWKNSLNQNICYIQERNMILRNLEKVCENISGIISNLLNDAKALNGKQLQEIDCSLISELPFPLDVQHHLHNLYNDNTLIYHNFICLLTSILHQVSLRLRKSNLVDLSQCLFQVEASIEDMKSVCNVFKSFLTSILTSTEETQNVLCENNAGHIYRENAFPPLVKSVLLMPSPLIKINTNCLDEKNDFYKLLQFTPKEITYKSLFSRYTRHNRNYTPDLRTNLFISRINIDDTMPSSNSDKQSLSTRFVTPRLNQLRKKKTGRYSRLFSTYMSKNVKANCSIMSLPSTAQANSSAIVSTTGEMPNVSDFNLDITARGFFNLSEESLTPIQYTPIKQNTSQNASEKMREMLDHEFKVKKPDLDELTEIQFINNEDSGTIKIKHENTSRRRSISDLVERYKKLMEISNHTTLKFQNEYMKHEIE